MQKIILSLTFVFAFFTTIAQKVKIVDTIDVYSCLMQREIKTVVIVPENYNDKKNRKTNYPVVYLLHGWSGDYANWIKKVPKIKDLATQHNLMIVCPDGSYESWYFDSPIKKDMQYESFLSAELPHHIDNNYRTINDAKARAITGLSMGGHGGIYVGLKHPETFGAIGSMSGALEVPLIKDKRYGIDKVLGDSSTYATSRNNYSTFKMVDTIKPTHQKIIFDCGTEDFCFGFAEELHKRLQKRKIPHDYIVRPGRHDWPYWSNAVGYQLLFFSEYFSRKEDKIK